MQYDDSLAKPVSARFEDEQGQGGLRRGLTLVQ
jgi:hypothetical protein